MSLPFVGRLRPTPGYKVVSALLALAATAAAASPTATAVVDHGVAAPVSNHRGTVSTVDAQGRDVVVMWLMDHRGGYAVLVVDALTGRSEQVPMPFPLVGDAPYASLLSRANKFYTVFGNHFVEFDVAKRTFTFVHATTPSFAMGMTEDDHGVIWAVLYPQSAVVSYDPGTGTFHDYGNVYRQNWPQYQRHVAADDTGWIYFALGMAESQVVALDPATGKAVPLLKPEERKKGTAYLYRDRDGKVYGQALAGAKEPWFELYRGERRPIGLDHPKHELPIATGSQGLFTTAFPDGRKLRACDLIDRQLVVDDGAGKTTTLRFEYTSEGAGIMGVATTPGNTICGGTMFPFRMFDFDPATGKWQRRRAWYQWNTLTTQGGHLLAGGYPGGFLLDWDPAKPWIDTEKNKLTTNPAYLTDCTPVIHRPMRLVAHPDGKTIIMGGGPDYGYTGGGLLFFDREKRTRELLTDRDVIPDQTTLSLVVLPDGRLLGGTTVQPGTGGEKKATEAELYLLDAAHKLAWHAAVMPGVQQYVDLRVAPSGLVYGIADRKTFFVFDPQRKRIVSQRDVTGEFGPSAYEQGPRVFVTSPKGAVYALFQKGVARVNLDTLELSLVAPSTTPIDGGGAYAGGRVYFSKGSHLYSVAVPE